MIHDNDRSGYIGASDTVYVMGNWNTKSFKNWWKIKQGEEIDLFTNEALETGKRYEHYIADAIGVKGEKDTQIIKSELKLRINYDFESDNTIYEIKTHNIKNSPKVTRSYYMQSQVEMFGRDWKKNLIMVFYALKEEDYVGEVKDIDVRRITYKKIKPDKKFIQNEYLPRLKILIRGLK